MRAPRRWRGPECRGRPSGTCRHGLPERAGFKQRLSKDHEDFAVAFVKDMEGPLLSAAGSTSSWRASSRCSVALIIGIAALPPARHFAAVDLRRRVCNGGTFASHCTPSRAPTLTAWRQMEIGPIEPCQLLQAFLVEQVEAGSVRFDQPFPAQSLEGTVRMDH
jgi:hypothetical protein